MLSQLEIRQRFEGRMVMFQTAMVILLLLLMGRMITLQWLQHEGFRLQADQNRVNVVPVLPTRGTITDRFGNGLAVNHISYNVQVIPERVEQISSTLARLSQLLGWSDEQLASIEKRIRKSRSDRPVLLQDKLQWQQVAPLSARLHHFPGVDIQAGTHRYYPYAELASHLIGYLSLAHDDDLKKGYLANEYVGRSGLERMLEAQLHGKPGSQREEVNARGRRIAVLDKVAPEMGRHLRSTIDIRLQQAASKALGKRTGAVVVMDVHTGEVLTLLSQPGFDTNHFITGLEYEQWQQWLNDKRKPLLNRTTQAAYPPASTLKMVTGFAGLRHRIPLATGHTQCEGHLELYDRDLRCWKRKGHKHVTLYSGLVESCDVYFYELGDQLGMQRLGDEMHLWGFGEKTGIILSPEARGHVPPPEQVLRNGRTRPWYRGETMITAIGQGSTTVTPLQMARFAAAIANGGQILKPNLIIGQTPEIQRQIEINPKHLEKVRTAMRGVVDEAQGTAHAALAWAPWKAAGKTGTAQVIAMAQDDEEEDTDPVLDRHKDHAWFMGYAPYEQPQIAFAVFVEHGGHGGSDAAPVAAAIIKELAGRQPPEQERAE